MRVLFLAAEAEPFVKIGGLGDVAGALPRALSRLAAAPGSSSGEAAIDVRLVLPYYSLIQNQGIEAEPLAAFSVPHIGGAIRAEAFITASGGVPVYLISGEPIPAHAPVYSLDSSLDAYKFTFFSLAALELARFLNWAPDAVHANDWHTAPAIYALDIRPDPFFVNTATLLEVHNLPYMGYGASSALHAFGLPPATDPTLPVWARYLPLPLGLLAADGIVTPSPTYAREVLTPEFGSGLDAFLRTRAASITGILNGMDTEQWDPDTDPNISSNFNPGSLERRAANKEALLSELGLEADTRTPLMVLITRLDPQKGVDLVPEALRVINDLPWRIAILGTGQPLLEAEVRNLETVYPDRVRALIRFDAALSRRLYAGADMVLMPSRYEPCGLTQMIAMRYGCVPVARSVGGLFDTIRDWEQAEESTGFLFGEAKPGALAVALRRALGVYADPDAWRALQCRGMVQDFSWEHSAAQFLKLYQSLTT